MPIGKGYAKTKNGSKKSSANSMKVSKSSGAKQSKAHKSKRNTKASKPAARATGRKY